MFTKSTAAIILAVFLGATAAAVAQGWQGGNGYYSPYARFGYPAERHDPTNTNGF